MTAQLLSLLKAAAYKAQGLAECVAEVLPSPAAKQALASAKKFVADVEVLCEVAR